MSSILDKTALTAIKCYKRYLSKHKGWKCAYGSVYGTSCSTMAEELIKKHGVVDAQPLIREQFVKCRNVYNELKANGELETPPDENATNSSVSNSSSQRCDSCDLVPIPCWGFGSWGGRKSGNGMCDIDGCEINACDIGDIGSC